MKKDLTQEEKVSIIQAHGGKKENILDILLEIQDRSTQGYIDKETAIIVADELHMTETKVFEVVTFYAMLKTKPQAKYVLKICNSTPCYFSKSETVSEVLGKELGIKMGETTGDGMFSYHYIPCAGACDVGPIIKVKETVYGNLDEKKIQQLIKDLKKEAAM